MTNSFLELICVWIIGCKGGLCQPLNQEQTNRQNWVSITFCNFTQIPAQICVTRQNVMLTHIKVQLISDHCSGQKLIEVQYYTVEKYATI